mmetsp:Transcript_51845/g.92466  ORF Transcript_51845/g.92466 Transcript_51845/m.92466 type:complete len:144 (-) Transcript_51845:38-469(-)
MATFCLPWAPKLHGKVVAPLHPQIAPNIASNVGTMVSGVATRKLAWKLSASLGPQRTMEKCFVPWPPKASDIVATLVTIFGCQGSMGAEPPRYPEIGASKNDTNMLARCLPFLRNCWQKPKHIEGNFIHPFSAPMRHVALQNP